MGVIRPVYCEQILTLFNLAFKGLVPLLNSSAVFFMSHVLQGYLLPTLVQEADMVADLGLAVLGLIKSLCVSLLNWLLSAMVDCPASMGTCASTWASGRWT